MIPPALSVRDARRYLAIESAKWPTQLKEIPREDWESSAQRWQIRTLRNNRFLVLIFDRDGQIRLSANRTAVADDRGWKDGITWDELMQLKRECGYGERCAIEIFPPDGDVVNVANIRHLWLAEAPAFMWRKGVAP